jgi:molybdenum cofactor cytidylyltransferase
MADYHLSVAPFVWGTMILGAGTSSRMGHPKLLLPWGSTSVVGHLLATWKDLGAAQLAVICASGDGDLEAELNKPGMPSSARIDNPDPGRGMFGSIQCAARWSGWNSQLTHWVIALGDQPHLHSSTLSVLIRFAAKRPEKNMSTRSRVRTGTTTALRGRHPVVLPRAAFRLLAASDCTTLREFLHANASVKELMEVDDPGFDLDIDTVADYERAILLAERSVSPGIHQGDPAKTP